MPMGLKPCETSSNHNSSHLAVASVGDVTVNVYDVVFSQGALTLGKAEGIITVYTALRVSVIVLA